MINNVVLAGRLVRDVELRQTSTGKEMTYFTLAVNRNFKNEQGVQAADFVLLLGRLQRIWHDF